MPRLDLEKLLFTRGHLKKPATLAITMLLVLLGYEQLPMKGETLSGPAQIVDGDTLRLGGSTRIRLYGIDAPESHQTCRKEGHSYPCGAESTEALRARIGDSVVSCEKEGTDPYQRIVAICHTPDGVDLNGWMVAEGHALAYRSYSNRYVAEETEAKAAHKGLWAGSFEKPWLYRKDKRKR